jgi:hypothetical protein
MSRLPNCSQVLERRGNEAAVRSGRRIRPRVLPDHVQITLAGVDIGIELIPVGLWIDPGQR